MAKLEFGFTISSIIVETEAVFGKYSVKGERSSQIDSDIERFVPETKAAHWVFAEVRHRSLLENLDDLGLGFQDN